MNNYLRDYTEKDGILIFDTVLDEQSSYDVGLLEHLIKAESSHFWFACRREKICQVFKSHVNIKARILEIGGGTGYIAEKLNLLGYGIEVSDIASNGLFYSKNRGLQKLYQFDLFNPPFKEAFDVICLFDVLEHLEDPNKALMKIKTMLKPGGQIILTVPAHNWLWNRDDVISGHKKRYTKKTLKQAFFHSGLKPISISYFFIFILPFLFLRTLTQRASPSPLKKNEELNLSIPVWLSSFCYFLTKLELMLAPILPNFAGGSLIAIARKD